MSKNRYLYADDYYIFGKKLNMKEVLKKIKKEFEQKLRSENE